MAVSVSGTPPPPPPRPPSPKIIAPVSKWIYSWRNRPTILRQHEIPHERFKKIIEFDGGSILLEENNSFRISNSSTIIFDPSHSRLLDSIEVWKIRRISFLSVRGGRILLAIRLIPSLEAVASSCATLRPSGYALWSSFFFFLPTRSFKIFESRSDWIIGRSGK